MLLHLKFQRIATRATNVTTPVKLIDRKVDILKMGWLVVEDVLMELATLIIYYGRWMPLKMREEDLKRVSWGLMQSP